MSNLFTERVLNMTAVTPQPEDYTARTDCFTAASVTPERSLLPGKASHPVWA